MAAVQEGKLGFPHDGEQQFCANAVVCGSVSQVGKLPVVVPPKPTSIFPPISTNYVQVHCGKHVGPIEDLQKVILGGGVVLPGCGMGGHEAVEQLRLEEADLLLKAPSKFPRVSFNGAEVEQAPLRWRVEPWWCLL